MRGGRGSRMRSGLDEGRAALNISTKTTLTTLVVVGTTFTLAGALLLREVRVTALEESHEQALLLSRTLAGSFAVPLAQGQHETIQRQLDQIAELPAQYPDVVSVLVADEAGLIVAATDPLRFGDPWPGEVPHAESLRETEGEPLPRIVVRMPIQSLVRAGSLEVVLSVREPWRAAREASRGILLSLFVGMIVFMATLTLLLNRLVVRPVKQLAHAAIAFSPGQAGLGLSLEGPREMRQLAGAFDGMAARLHDYTDTLEAKVAERTQELRNALEALQGANHRLQELATTDALTSVGNRRVFTDRLALELDRARRSSSPLSLVLFDLDHFKRLNDTLGHQEGDRALVRVAALLADGRRSIDLVARFGGEEFVLLLPDTAHADALRLADRLREAIAEKIVGCTASAGVSTFPDQASDGASLVRAADQAMYAAKSGGRNRVVGAQPAAAVTAGAAS